MSQNQTFQKERTRETDSQDVLKFFLDILLEIFPIKISQYKCNNKPLIWIVFRQNTN